MGIKIPAADTLRISQDETSTSNLWLRFRCFASSGLSQETMIGGSEFCNWERSTDNARLFSGAKNLRLGEADVIT